MWWWSYRLARRGGYSIPASLAFALFDKSLPHRPPFEERQADYLARVADLNRRLAEDARERADSLMQNADPSAEEAREKADALARVAYLSTEEARSARMIAARHAAQQQARDLTVRPRPRRH
jgi:hypothetical protein